MFRRIYGKRPVAASIAALVLVAAAVVAVGHFTGLAGGGRPQVVIKVRAFYPGAEAGRIKRELALPIEGRLKSIGGVASLSRRMNPNGEYLLTITFTKGTDPRAASRRVKQTLSLVLPSLPAGVLRRGVSACRQED